MKRGSVLPVILSILAIILLIAGMFLFFVLYEPDNSKLYEGEVESGRLVNPVKEIAKQIEQDVSYSEDNSLGNVEEIKYNEVKDKAINEFNEDYVYYLLYSIKAYNLHNPPLSSNNPEIEIIFGDEVYSAIVSNGLIKVNKWAAEDEDIRITSSKEEVVKMLLDEKYIQESFANGGSSIDLVSGKSELFSKGYLNLYTELTGKTVTGNVIRIYLD